MPKEERVAKFRNDSVDEIDTTDLENWTLKREETRKMRRTLRKDMQLDERTPMPDFEEFYDFIQKPLMKQELKEKYGE